MSITFDSTWEDIEPLIRQAAETLREEPNLFLIQANERSITHRFAVHLEPLFLGWQVDCEYNRIGNEAITCKRLTLSPKKVEADGLEGSLVFPDIIIHHRGSSDPKSNLLVIEVKTKWSQIEDSHDYHKLKAFTGVDGVKQSVRYKYGFFVKFNKDGGIDTCERFP